MKPFLLKTLDLPSSGCYITSQRLVNRVGQIPISATGVLNTTRAFLFIWFQFPVCPGSKSYGKSHYY